MTRKFSLCLVLTFLLLSFPAYGAEVKPDASPKIIDRYERGLLLDISGTRVLLLAGSPYQIGYQHGKLLKNEVKALTASVIALVTEAEHNKDSNIPSKVLQTAFERTSKFIDKRYFDEMRGLADGAGIPLEDVQLANTFPELFHCSGFALFGKATSDGTLLHGRILDYMVNQGLQNFAAVMVVKPDGFNSFVSVGYVGFVGSVTGMNQKQIALGEMGGKGQGNWDGTPMTFLMRKALEEANSLEQAVDIFRNAKRTCEYYYVISDGKIPDARALYCTTEVFESLKPGQTNSKLPHKVNDAVLVSADRRYEELFKLVDKKYGTIDVNYALDLMNRPVAMKDCLHRVLFAPQRLELWIANAASPDKENFTACYQPYYHYDLKKLLDMIPPPKLSEPLPDKQQKNK